MTGFALLPGTTLERAKVEGAMYVADFGKFKRMFRLPPRTIEKQNCLPQPEIAWLLHELMEFQKGQWS
jgi:hypothetical protein